MNGFDRVSYKTHVFKREFSDTVKTVDKIIYTRASFDTNNTFPIKFYNCNGDTYGYSTDKNVRKVVGSTYVLQGFSSDVVPLILPVIINGEKDVIFISDQTAKIGDQTITGVPYGNAGAFCAGRLFIAVGNKLKYSEEFNFVNFSVGLDFGGFIELDQNAGEILYLAKNGDGLYVIAEHAIFSFSPYGKPYEFKLERVQTTELSIVKDSVFGEGDVVLFLNKKDLCMFTNDKVQYLNNSFLSFGTYYLEVAGGYNGLYVMPFTMQVGNSRIKYVYAYDFFKKKEVLEKVSTDVLNAFHVAGEYASRMTDGRYFRLSIGTETETVPAVYDGEYDFGTCAKKSVCKIEAHITGSAEIVVSGDGTYRAVITEKCNSVSCFVHGQLFNITFENASSDFKLDRLAINYVIHGE